jgi:hypothetical protein
MALYVASRLTFHASPHNLQINGRNVRPSQNIYLQNPPQLHSYFLASPNISGSSVSIVSGYGLDDRAIEVRSPTEAREFFLYPLCPDQL